MSDTTSPTVVFVYVCRHVELITVARQTFLTLQGRPDIIEQVWDIYVFNEIAMIVYLIIYREVLLHELDCLPLIKFLFHFLLLFFGYRTCDLYSDGLILHVADIELTRSEGQGRLRIFRWRIKRQYL